MVGKENVYFIVFKENRFILDILDIVNSNNIIASQDSDDLAIGIGITLDTAEYGGLIDEVKIFNYALTETQVRTEYNSGAVRFGQ